MASPFRSIERPTLLIQRASPCALCLTTDHPSFHGAIWARAPIRFQLTDRSFDTARSAPRAPSRWRRAILSLSPLHELPGHRVETAGVIGRVTGNHLTLTSTWAPRFVQPKHPLLREPRASTTFADLASPQRPIADLLSIPGDYQQWITDDKGPATRCSTRRSRDCRSRH